MSVMSWGERFSPDLATTIRRFPFPSLLQTLATIVVVAVVNEWLGHQLDEGWSRAAAGLMTAAVFALAGDLFAESRPGRRPLALFLRFALPILVAASFEVRDTTNFVFYLLPMVAVFWLSVAAFTRRGTGEDQQDRFWWLNHLAFTSATLAAAGFVLVFAASFAILMTVSILFGLNVANLAWKFVLPVAGFFLAPLYWLTTIPELDAYDGRSLTQPDFLSRAIGFIGQFILAPVLIAYAAILLAYTVQIAVTRQLPQGLLGWMVLGFTTTGAATWLLLYPPFMRERLVVRLFRRLWFWLTIIPLILLAIAVETRVAAYGLTTERLIVAAGGVWAGLLTAFFLLRRGDIRLIPALAGLMFLVLAVGPWNVENWPRADQAQRLDQALAASGATGKGGAPHWTPETAGRVKGAVHFLMGDPAGRLMLERVLAGHEIDYDSAVTDSSKAIASLPGLEASAGGTEAEPTTTTIKRPGSAPPVDIAATPLYLGPMSAWRSSNNDVGPLHMMLSEDNKLQISDSAGNKVAVDISAWAVDRKAGGYATSSFDFDLAGRHYRVAIDSVDLFGMDTGKQLVSTMTGALFAGAAPVATPAPTLAATPKP